MTTENYLNFQINTPKGPLTQSQRTLLWCLIYRGQVKARVAVKASTELGHGWRTYQNAELKAHLPLVWANKDLIKSEWVKLPSGYDQLTFTWLASAPISPPAPKPVENIETVPVTKRIKREFKARLEGNNQKKKKKSGAVVSTSAQAKRLMEIYKRKSFNARTLHARKVSWALHFHFKKKYETLLKLEQGELNAIPQPPDAQENS